MKTISSKALAILMAVAMVLLTIAVPTSAAGTGANLETVNFLNRMDGMSLSFGGGMDYISDDEYIVGDSNSDSPKYPLTTTDMNTTWGIRNNISLTMESKDSDTAGKNFSIKKKGGGAFGAELRTISFEISCPASIRSNLTITISDGENSTIYPSQLLNFDVLGNATVSISLFDFTNYNITNQLNISFSTTHSASWPTNSSSYKITDTNGNESSATLSDSENKFIFFLFKSTELDAYTTFNVTERGGAEVLEASEGDEYTRPSGDAVPVGYAFYKAYKIAQPEGGAWTKDLGISATPVPGLKVTYSITDSKITLGNNATRALASGGKVEFELTPATGYALSVVSVNGTNIVNGSPDSNPHGVGGGF